MTARLPSCSGRRLADVPIEYLSAALAQEAAGVLYGHCRPQTMNRAALMPFAAVAHFGAENEWMPYLRIKSFKAVDRRTPRLAEGEDDVRRLLAAARAARPKKCDRYKADHPYRFILLLFLFRQGWRISETLRLTWAQVNLPAGRFVNVTVAKGNAVKNRIVMHPDVYEALAALPADDPERAARERRDRVFPWCDRQNVYRWLLPFCADVGIHFRPHMAQVEFASQLNEAGQTDSKIMNVCTWTDTRSVARYTRTSEAECETTIASAGRPRRRQLRETRNKLREAEDKATITASHTAGVAGSIPAAPTRKLLLRVSELARQTSGPATAGKWRAVGYRKARYAPHSRLKCGAAANSSQPARMKARSGNSREGASRRPPTSRTPDAHMIRGS
jgi:integrase